MIYFGNVVVISVFGVGAHELRPGSVAGAFRAILWLMAQCGKRRPAVSLAAGG